MEDVDIPYRLNGSILTLKARVGSDASTNAIGGIWVDPERGTQLIVRVSEPPDKNKANKAVLSLIAKMLGLPISSISITAGGTKRLKSIACALRTDEERRTAIQKLEALVGSALKEADREKKL